MKKQSEENRYSRDVVRRELIGMAEESYRLFNERLVSTAYPMLGVRLPALRVMAKKMMKGDWRAFLEQDGQMYYEEVMLKGLITAQAKMEQEERYERIGQFLPLIDNWAVCDSFCSSIRVTPENENSMWEFLQPFLAVQDCFSVRFGVVMILDHFVKEDWRDKAFRIFDGIGSEEYYVRMAVAWAVSVFFVAYPEETMGYLQNNRLDGFTYRKALQKIVESYRVSAEQKAIIRRMREKIV